MSYINITAENYPELVERSEKTVLLCAGNIKGAGEALTQRIRDLGKEVGS